MSERRIQSAPKTKGENDKYGIVLGGGGSKGCYHVGVWQAFNEEGIEFDALSGTSIGALVGIFYPGNRIGTVTDFVMTMEPDHIAQDLPYYPSTLKETIKGGKTILNFIIRYFDSRMDITPLREHFKAMFDYETFKNSPVRYACMTWNDTKKVARGFYKGEITKDNAEQIVMASAACYPAFPKVVIDGDEYMDGMYADNVPIELLNQIQPDATWTVVVDLHDPQEALPPALTDQMFYLQPLLQPGNALDFSPAHAARLYAQGYLETRKSLGRLPGYLYTFREEDEPAIAIVEDYLARQITNMKIVLPQVKGRPLTEHLFKSVLGYVPNDLPTPFMDHYEFGSMVEALALMSGLDPIALYDYRYFIETVLERLKTQKMTTKNSEEFALLELLGSVRREEIPQILFHTLKSRNGRFPERIEQMKDRIPVSYTLAVIRYCLDLLLSSLTGTLNSQNDENEDGLDEKQLDAREQQRADQTPELDQSAQKEPEAKG